MSNNILPRVGLIKPAFNSLFMWNGCYHVLKKFVLSGFNSVPATFPTVLLCYSNWHVQVLFHDAKVA